VSATLVALARHSVERAVNRSPAQPDIDGAIRWFLPEKDPAGRAEGSESDRSLYSRSSTNPMRRLVKIYGGFCKNLPLAYPSMTQI
jgi:hypothetical protein